MTKWKSQTSAQMFGGRGSLHIRKCICVSSFGRGGKGSVRGLAFSSEGGGSQIYWGVINLWKEKWGVIRFFDDQNVGSHKMTTDSVFILFKKTDFDTVLACLGGKVYR